MERRDATHPKGIHLEPTVKTTLDDGSVFEVHGTPFVEGMTWQKAMRRESSGREARKAARTFGLRQISSRI